MVGGSTKIYKRGYHVGLTDNLEEIGNPCQKGTAVRQAAQEITQIDQVPAAELKLGDLEKKHHDKV